MAETLKTISSSSIKSAQNDLASLTSKAVSTPVNKPQYVQNIQQVQEDTYALTNYKAPATGHTYKPASTVYYTNPVPTPVSQAEIVNSLTPEELIDYQNYQYELQEEAAQATAANTPKVAAPGSINQAAKITGSTLSPSPTTQESAQAISNGLMNTAAAINQSQSAAQDQLNAFFKTINTLLGGDQVLHIQSVPTVNEVLQEVPKGTPTAAEIVAAANQGKTSPTGSTLLPVSTKGSTSGSTTSEESGGEYVTSTTLTPTAKTTAESTSSSGLSASDQAAAAKGGWTYVNSTPVTTTNSLSDTLKKAIAGATALVTQPVQTVQNYMAGFSGTPNMSIMDIPDAVNSGLDETVALTQESLGNILASAVDSGMSDVEGCTGPLCDIQSALTSGLDGTINGALGTIAGVIATIAAYIQSLGSNISTLAQTAYTGLASILATAKSIPSLLEQAVTNIYSKISSTLEQIPEWIKGAYDWATQQITSLATTIYDDLKGAYEWAFSQISSIVSPIVEDIKGVIQPLITAAQDGWNAVQGLWSYLQNAWSNLTALVQSYENQIGEIWNKLTTTDWVQAISQGIGSLISWITSVLEPMLMKLLPTQADLENDLKKVMSALGPLADDVLKDLCSDPLSRG